MSLVHGYHPNMAKLDLDTDIKHFKLWELQAEDFIAPGRPDSGAALCACDCRTAGSGRQRIVRLYFRHYLSRHRRGGR